MIGILKTIFILSLLFTTTRSFADILYLDLNMSSHEVYRLKKNFGGKVTVLPDIPNEDRNTMIIMNTHIEKIEKDRAVCWHAGKDCSVFQDILKIEYAKRRVIYDRNRLDLNVLTAILEQDKKLQRFDTLILSGHSGTGDFYGELASMPIPEIRKLVAKFPHLRDTIKSIFLWGCYTLTPYKIKQLWLTIFPNLQTMVGFIQVAPRADREANLNALSSLIRAKGQIQEAKNSAQLAKIIFQNKFIHFLNYAVYSVNCDCYITGNYQGSLSEVSKQICLASEPEYQKWADVFKCYYLAEGESKCNEVPSNPGDSDLRSAYNFFQNAEHCFNLESDASDEEAAGTETPTLNLAGVPDTARMIRLIKYKDVLKNFKVFYKDDINEINSILRGLHAPEELQVPDLGDYALTRRKVIDYLRALHDFIIVKHIFKDFITQIKATDNSEQVQRLEVIYHNLETMLYEVSPCIPFGWIEPDSHAVPTSCPY